jgi:probable phosphoglycerate mutase
VTITLAILRHTEAVHSSSVYLPDADRELTPAGREHARALAPRIRGFAPEAVFCSSLLRATETWRLAGRGMDVRAHVHPGLAERRFPTLEGLTLAEIAARVGPAGTAVARVSTDLVNVPGEETLQEAGSRVAGAVRSIAADARAAGRRRILLVTHGGPSGWLLCHLLGLTFERGRMFRHGLGRFHVLRLAQNLDLADVVTLNCADPRAPADTANATERLVTEHTAGTTGEEHKDGKERSSGPLGHCDGPVGQREDDRVLGDP